MDSSIARSKRNWEKANIQTTSKVMPSLPIEKYTGLYKDVFYGEVMIEKDSSGLVLKFKQTPQLVAQLIPFQFETFLAKFNNPDLRADAYATFTIGPDGNVDELKMKIIDPDCDISFDELLLKHIRQSP